jgi:hypothetical protein
MRRTPVLAFIDGPSRPAIPDRRYLLIKVVLSFFLLLAGGALAAITYESMAGIPLPPDEARLFVRSELHSLLQRAARWRRRRE